MDEFSEKFARFITIIQFIIFGPVMLVFSILTDTIVFIYNLYTSSDDGQEEIERDTLSLKSVELFKVSCEEELKAHRKESSDTKSGSTMVEFVKLNRRLQKKLDIQGKIHMVLFDNSDDDKFVEDPVTKKKKLHPRYLKGIKEFNQLKRLAANCSDKTGLVDTNLLSSLLDQVNLRVQMLQIEIKSDELDLGKDEDELYLDSMYELGLTNPKSVESSIASDNEAREGLEATINEISGKLEHLQGDVAAKFLKFSKRLKAL